MHEFIGKNHKNLKKQTKAALRYRVMVTTITAFSATTCIILIASLVFQYFIQKNNDSRLQLAMTKYDLVVDITSNFKWTVQSWKDILLRGHKIEDRDKYLKDLNYFHNLTLTKSIALKNLIAPQDYTYIDQFLNLEGNLLKNYANALELAKSTPDFDYRSADHSVRGQDRKVLTPIIELVKKFNDKVKDDVQYNSGLTKIVQLIITTALLITVIGLWLAAITVAKHRKIQDEQLEIQSGKLQLLGELSANIIHDIKNPIMIIGGNCELITSAVTKNTEPNRDSLQKLAEEIRKSTSRIATIVSSINRFTRHSADLPFESISVAQIVEESADIVRSKFSSLEVNLQKSVIDPNMMISCRSVEICQVLVNLLINGADAVHSLTERWVRIDAIDRGDYGEITVTDSGQGIDKANLCKMSHAFYTTKKIGQGTGQGIAITRSIIARHEGYFYYDNPSDHTCFIIGIPKCRVKLDT